MDIESNIRENLTAFRNGEATLENVSQVLWINLCSSAQIERTPAIKSLIDEIITKYQDDIFNEDTVVDLFLKIASGNLDEVYTYMTMYSEEIVDYGGDSYGSYSGGGSGGSSKKNSSEVTVDVDYEKLNSIMSKYEELENEINEIELNESSLVSAYVEPLKIAIQNGKSEVTGYLDELKKSIVEILNITADIDDAIKDIELDNITFADISKVIYDRSQNSKAVEANAEFFKNNGCDVDGDIVTLTVKGQACKYDLSSHKLYINDSSEGLNVHFYIPQKALTNKDYSKLNTYTFFSYKEDFNLLDNQDTNSVIVRITKNPNTENFTQLDEAAMATRFINKVAGTELNDGCQNIIAGDSKYGAYSLKIAAENPKLYQTVCCVNNAAVIGGVNSEPNQKTGFATAEDAAKLNGTQNIIFINTANDQNIDHNYQAGKHYLVSTCSYDKSYLYTGAQAVSELCPDSNVYVFYDEANGASEAVKAFKGIGKDFSNLHYDGAVYSNLTDVVNGEHGTGREVVYDLLDNLANYNENNI